MAHNTADDIIWNMLKNKQEVLSKVGIFAENLQKATHTAAPTSVRSILKAWLTKSVANFVLLKSHKIEEFFSPAKPAPSHPEKGGIRQYLSPAPAKAPSEQNNNNEKAKESNAESDIAAFLNDDDDEAFMDLDI